MDHHRFPPSSNGGRPQHQQLPQQLQQQSSTLSRRTLGLRTTTGPLHSQPKATPALLKSSRADFGEDYVDSQRRNRFGRNGGGRARSEIAEVLSNGGNSRLNTSYFQHRRETSYNDDDRHSLKAVRSTSYYDRPRSSFEPAMNHSISTSAAPRIIRNRQDDWQEVEQRRHQYSSDEDFDDEELESAESDQLREELEMYNGRRGGNQGYGSGNGAARMSASYHYHSTSRQQQPRQEFTENDICFFGMLKLTPQKARQFITMKEPPSEFWNLTSVEKAAYLYYFSLYKQYIVPVEKFHKIFNREFFKYTADGDSDDVALMKICKHTYDEYDLRRQRINKQAYDRSRQHLFSDDRATPDSRATSYCEQLDESDITSVDSGAKEPHRFTKPHAFASFAVGGKLLVLNPEFSISTVQLIDVKRKIRDRANLRNIDAMEHFKGPLIIGETPSHTPLLFIERQINNIRNSEIYRQNPLSSDANDVLLIWRLLEMLIRQHGNVTGPDLARLLTENYSFSSPPKPVRGRADKEYLQPTNGGNGTASPMFAAKDERRVDQRAMDRFTQFLLGGYIDEAIESATSDGLFFDALILAYRMFGNDRRKMEQIESKLLSYRDPQHPSLTLLSVASQMPVPILSNMSATDDTSAWRAHIAIVLANLNNNTAMYTVHQLGLALSRKEFNAAADFCFLAVNLLTQHDCFAPVDPSQQSDDEEPFRRHITLINASLPDDEYYSTKTRYGWSIVDFQATEIYDFALKMSQRPIAGGLTASAEYQKCRLEYAQMLAEYGGAATSAFKYCTSIVGCIWDKSYQQSASMLNDLCDLADRLHCAANQTTEELQWVPELRKVAAQIISNELANLPKQADSGLLTAIQDQSIPDANFIISPTSGAGFRTSTPIQPLGFVPHPNIPIPPLQQHHPQPPQFYNPVQQHNNNLGIPVSEAIDIGATPAPTPHKNDHDDESILPLHQPHSHYHHQQSPELRKHSLVDNLIHSSKDALGFGSSTTLGKDDEESILPVHQLPRQGSIEHSLPSQSPPPLSPPLSIQQQQQSSPFSEPQLSPSFYPSQPFSYQQPPLPQQHQQFQQPQQRHRTESQQSSDPFQFQQQQQHFQPNVNPPAIPSQDFSAFSQPSIKPEPSVPPQQQQQQNVEQKPQQQPQPQPMQQQQQPQQSQPQKQQQPEKKQEKSSGGGLFGGLAKKIVKYIPSGNEMKLPDDSKSNISWDEKLGRWVGEGIEEPADIPPPPMMMSSADATAGNAPVTSQSSGQSQASNQPQAPSGMAPSAPAPARPHRKPATSRYANAKTIANVASPVLAPEGFGLPQMPTAAAMPPSFGFMPTVPDNAETNGDDAANPFSYHPAQPDNTNSQ